MLANRLDASSVGHSLYEVAMAALQDDGNNLLMMLMEAAGLMN